MLRHDVHDEYEQVMLDNVEKCLEKYKVDKNNVIKTYDRFILSN